MTNFNKTIILFAVSFFSQLALSAQTLLLQEDFNTCAVPSGWLPAANGNPDAVWFVGQPQNENSDGTSIDGSCMLIWDDDATGQNTDPWSMTLTSPSFDGSAFSTITLNVDVHFRNYNGSASLKIKVWDGTAYQDVVVYQDAASQTGEQFSEYYTFSADLAFHANDDMKLLFEYDDGADWAWWAGIDNISVTGEGSATNLVVEDFNDCEAPNGWFFGINSGEAPWQIGLVDNGNTASTSMNGSCFAYFDDDGLGEDAPVSDAFFSSPAFDGTQYANIYLDFDFIFRRIVEGEQVGIGVWDGTTFHFVQNYLTDIGGPGFDSYVHERVDLSQWRFPEMVVVFYYADGDGWGWWAGIDNVKVSGEGLINDICENAFDLELDVDCQSVNTQNAFFQGTQPSCSGNNVGGIWYNFEAITSGIAQLTTNATMNDVVTIFDGNCTTMSELYCSNYDEHGFTGEKYLFDVVAGQEYLIRISGEDGRFGTSRGTVCAAITMTDAYATPPVNDICTDAIILNDGTVCINGNNINATTQGPVPSLNELSRHDIWYQYTATLPGFEIQTNADFADVITVYTGACNNLGELVSNENGQSLIVENATVGTTYWIQITGFFATIQGDVCMAVVPIQSDIPDNDLCINAYSLTVDGECVTANNLNADYDAPQPSCEVFPSANVWFEFVAPASEGVQINTGADFIHSVAIFGGDCANLEEVFCAQNPIACDGYIDIEGLVSGETYWISISSVDNYFGNPQTGNLCIAILDKNTITPFEGLDVNVVYECNGEGLGELIITTSGGQGTLTFEGNQNGEMLASGESYLIIVDDENGCQKSAMGTVSCGEVICNLTSSIATTNISCNNANDGTATISVENNNGEVAILWDNGATSATIDGLTPGNYEVTVTDDGGCASTSTFTIAEPQMLSITTSATDESGFESNDGSVFASPIGGTAPYTYLWSNGSTSPNQNGLSADNYSVTITDFNNCTTIQSITIEPFVCNVSGVITAQDVDCFGEQNGTANLILTNATGNITYEWSNGSITADAQELGAGTYSVIAIDDNNCPVELSIAIEQPTLLTTTINTTGESAASADDGTATALPQGGSEPYSYLWSNGLTTGSIMDLSPDNYTVTITDANECSIIQTVTVNAFNCFVEATISGIDVDCADAANGSATAAMIGGSGNVQYEWSNEATTATIDNLSPGVYMVTIIDESNCPAVSSVTIEAPAPIISTIANQTNVNCQGNAVGSVSLEVAGGDGDYTINWSDGQSGSTATALDAGTYEASITDGNNCATTFEVTILVDDNENPIVSAQNLTITLDETGQASIETSDIDTGSSDNCGIATSNLSINTFDCNQLGGNEVVYSITDVNGNTNSSTISIMVIDDIMPAITCPANIIANNCDGLVTYDLPSVTDNCSIASFELVSGLGSGANFPIGTTIETYEAIDAAGNMATCAFEVTIENTLAAQFDIEKPACNGETGTATAQTSGGDGNYNYFWEDGQTTQTATNLLAGSYKVTITDESNCELVETILVTEPTPLIVDITDILNETSTNAQDGVIMTSVNGGDAPYTYAWTLNGMFISDEANPGGLVGGTYLLTLIDANNCTVLIENIEVSTTVSVTDTGLYPYITLFPNPTKGKVMINFDLPEASEIRTIVYDITGKQLFNLAPIEKAMGNIELDLNQLPASTYTVKLIIGTEVWLKRVILTD